VSERRPEAPEEPGHLSSRPVFQGRIVDLRVDTVRFPDGSTGELEMIRHPGASAVLPLLGDRGAEDPVVLLLRQYRYAAGGYLYEVPAGRPAFAGEDWEVCARRELEEETGLVAGRLTRLTSLLTTPGFTDERIHLFLAEDLRPGASALDADEFIETVTLPISEALQMVRDGEIEDAKTMCTLLFAAGFLLGM
jgi:ADP-ribose pyrophosphatase